MGRNESDQNIDELKKRLAEAEEKAAVAEALAAESKELVTAAEKKAADAEEKLGLLEKNMADAERHAADVEAEEAQRLKAEEKVTIIIAEDSGPGGQDDVSVGVNGIEYQIKRNVEVEVPRSLVSVLNDAVTEEYNLNSDGQITGSRKVPRFNVRVIG